jgi:ubiquitin-like protein Pup
VTAFSVSSDPDGAITPDDRLEVTDHQWRAVMADRETGGQRRVTRETEEVEETQAEPESDVRERHEKLSDDVDSMLDEIDEVLEENAEEFVRGYIQKGGE